MGYYKYAIVYSYVLVSLPDVLPQFVGGLMFWDHHFPQRLAQVTDFTTAKIGGNSPQITINSPQIICRIQCLSCESCVACGFPGRPGGVSARRLPWGPHLPLACERCAAHPRRKIYGAGGGTGAGLQGRRWLIWMWVKMEDLANHRCECLV